MKNSLHKKKAPKITLEELKASAQLRKQKSKVQQQFKEQCDVNNIIAKYIKTGELHHEARKLGVYGDMSSEKDYLQSMQTVVDANHAFNILPSKIRERFSNQPSQMLAFLEDNSNYDEAVKLGLIDKKPAPSKLEPEASVSAPVLKS